MYSRSPYSPYDETDGNKEMGTTDLVSTSKQTYITKKNRKSDMKDDQDLAMTDHGRSTRDRSPDIYKSSDSYYSDDDNTTYGSQTPSSKSVSPNVKKTGYKVRSSTPVRKSVKKVSPKYTPNKRGPHTGIRSQSLNKESSPKDIDGLTKRILAARLLKINDLNNEVAELQIQLEECQKENKTLKRLQYRQEKALNKFEDTENDISQLISRHNNEIRTLKELLRKSQERERNAEKRLKDTEEELYKTNSALKKLKQLSENKHLIEREELTKKVDYLESKFDERQRRVKELEKNIELTQSSLQRQLMLQKKKTHDVQEENKLLQEELQRLTQRLKEKEKELDVKNIYAYRLSKPSSWKDKEATPRKQGANLVNSKAVQTNSYPSPQPTPTRSITEDLESQQEVNRKEQDNLEKLLIQEAENHKKEKQQQVERKQHQEEKLIRDKEQSILENKAQRLREEWEKEEFERMKKEDLYQDNFVEPDMKRTEEDRLKKDLLLAKMLELDRENKDSLYSASSKPVSPTPLVDTLFKTDTISTNQRMYKFSEPTEKLFNGLPVSGGQDTKRDVLSRRNDSKLGSYTPSFGRGKSSAHSLKKESSDEYIITNSQLDIKKEKKSNLIEQLFGNNSTLPSIPKDDDQTDLTISRSTVTDNNSRNILPWEQIPSETEKVTMKFSGAAKNTSSSRHHLQHPPRTTVINAVDCIDDEIEEVAL